MPAKARGSQVWIEVAGQRVSGREAAQVVRDVFTGVRDSEDCRVCAAVGFGTRIRGSCIKGRESEFPIPLTDRTSFEPSYDHKAPLASTEEEK